MKGPAAVHETHVGLVLLHGDRAYKMKKPVRTPFLDFSTPERRRVALARELDLNRRLAPDVYLGLSEVVPGAELGGDSEPLLVMRRMPDDRRLSTLVRDDEPVDGHLRELARLMATFHTRADRCPVIDADGGLVALAGRWADNLAQLEPFRDRVLDGSTLAELRRLSARFLAARGALFARRVTDGRIVDGHGDLVADDVFCLDDGPRVLDCLEFDDHLRHVDVLDDVAFLAMDLERLRRPDLAAAFLAAYAEFSGDPLPASLVHHYVAYRAVVRAKVACLRHDQGGDRGDDHVGEAAAQAERYATIALRHLRAGAVRLVLVGGLPGTGKSTIAGALADRFGAVVLSTDPLRKETAGLDPLEPSANGFRRGLYSPERTNRTYQVLLHHAGLLLDRGESVVLDASWISAEQRRAARRLAADHAADLVALQCHTRPAIAAARIAGRGRTASDATPTIATAMAVAADPWPEALPIDTELPLERCVARAVNAWEATCRPDDRAVRRAEAIRSCGAKDRLTIGR